VGAGSGARGAEPRELASLVDRQTRALMGLRKAIEGVAELDAQPLVAPPGAWARRVRERALALSTPRLGVFYQHAPQPLRVPRSMLHVRPPQPAPVISIVTPSLNQGEFLRRTLRCVLDQDYPALEYVVQDGGSSDDSVAILREHEDRLARWTSEPDTGQADAINRGFAGTHGEIMAALNSDDLLLPGSLAWVARYFEQHHDVDAVYGQRVIVDEQDRQIGIWITPPHDDAMLGLSNVVPHETLFWRRSAWERVGGMDPSFRFALDWDFLLRLSEAGARVVRANRYLGAFRAHRAQKSQAELAVGDAESARLRERKHGRPMTWEEATARMRPYLRRHVVHHTAHRLLARLPVARVEVRWD
jgi:GT2 family glycosyltransferase